MIDLRHLRALSAIVQRGTLAAAATHLRCTPSALSHLLSDLEAQCGLPVVERATRPLRLTAAGRRMLTAAQQVLPLIDAAETDLVRLRQGTAGRLLISLECHSCFDWLVPTLDAYRQAHPSVELDLRTGPSFDPLPALSDGVVDLVITAERGASPGIQAEALFRYDIVAVLPPRHPLLAKPWLSPADFAGQTVVTYPVDECRLDVFTRFLNPAGVAPAKRRTVELTAMVVQVVAGGHGIAGLPRWAVADAARRVVVALRPLGKDGLWTDLYALRRREQVGVAYLDAFVALACSLSLRTLEGIKRVPPARRTARG
jgi:LysR family transcriptional regulator for metE and metH